MHFISFRYDLLFPRYNNLKIIFSRVTYTIQQNSTFSFHQCEFRHIFMMYFYLPNTNILAKVGFTSKFEKNAGVKEDHILTLFFSKLWHDIQLLATDSCSARKNTLEMIIYLYGEKLKFCWIVYMSHEKRTICKLLYLGNKKTHIEMYFKVKSWYFYVALIIN